MSAPKLVNTPERPSKLEIKGVGNKSDQQTSEYRRVSLGSPMGQTSSSRLLLEQASPRPFRKVDEGREEDHGQPLSKSRKESAHSSPSTTVLAGEPPHLVRITT